MSSGLQVAYLLTGSRSWSLDLTGAALTALLLDDADADDLIDLTHALALGIARRWLAPLGASTRSAGHVESLLDEMDRPARARRALARLDEHQRAAIVLHDHAGLPVEALAELLGMPADLAYAQIIGSRALFRRLTGLLEGDDIRVMISAAAIDAPRQALWPAIEADLRAGFVRLQRRRRLQIAGALVAAFIVIASLAALVMTREGHEPVEALQAGVPTARATVPATPFTVLPTSTPTPAADVGDAIVVYSRDAGAARTGLFHDDAAVVPLLGEMAVEEAVPVVSPDGALVVMVWYGFDEDGATGYITAWDGDLAARRWEHEVAANPDARFGERPDIQLSAAVDHHFVYMARHSWRRGDVIEIDVLDRATGERIETITTNLPGFAANDVRLLAPPGPGQVHLFAITGDSPTESGSLTITYLAYAVPGGELVHGRVLRDQPDSRAFFLYESRPIAGSTTLFGVDYTSWYRQLAVHFFDIPSGRLQPRLVLPFQPVADPLPYQQAISNSGHWLYVLSPASLEVAVVNLFDRSLAGIVPLDPGALGNVPVSPRYLQSREMQLSPDGSRLYALGTGDDGASGVWVIDVASWTVIDHWAPEARPAEILLADDGQTLYLHDETRGAGNEADLLAIDTATGAARTLARPGTGRYSLASMAALYRRTYALSPAVEGRQPGSSPFASPLATARLDVVQGRVPVNEPVSVDVRFQHPLTGEPVAREGNGARFDEPAGVRVTWEHEDGALVILELGRTSFGHYQGFVRLPEPGEWSARLDLDWPDESALDRSLIGAGRVIVLPAEPGDGGTVAGAPGG